MTCFRSGFNLAGGSIVLRYRFMLLEYFLSAFALGVIVAIPPGSVTVIACQRAMQYGFGNSLVFTAGSRLSDIFYISLVYYGLTNFVHSDRNKMILWIVCGLLLLVVGAMTIRGLKDHDTAGGAGETMLQSRPVFTFVSGILITLTNPVTILGWLAIAGNFFLLWRGRLPAAVEYGPAVIAVIIAGVLAWFVPLTFAVSRVGKLLNVKLQKFLIAFSGACLIVFGSVSLYSAFRLACAG